MNRVAFITHRGKRILLQDCTDLNPGPEFTRLIKTAKKMFAAEPPKSVLSLFDATGCSFSDRSLSEVKDFTIANTPYIKVAAVVGIDGLLQVALSSVIKASGREYQVFKTRNEALEYLASLE